MDSHAHAAQWIRDRLFPRVASSQPRIGAEVELLAFDAGTHAVARLDGRLGAWLQDTAARNGWKEAGSGKGAPLYHIPGGMTITLEPGGQIEFSSQPHASAATLIDQLQSTGAQLIQTAAEFGLELKSVGIDPFHDLKDVPLQLTGARYARMDRYFAARGPAGARMMRQTAALQLSVDPAYDPSLTWSVLNRAVPVFTALFANSRTYNGIDSGYASYRARQWRELDPTRTGVFREADAAAEYARFALDALFIGEAEPYQSFRELVRTGVCDWSDDWEYHLSTLFPEVRPKGYYELRCIDAIPLTAVAAPIALITAIAWDETALHEADALLPVASDDSLVVAARSGLRDDQLRAYAEQLTSIALSAGARITRGDAEGAAFDVLRGWVAESLAAGRAPLEDDLVRNDHVADHALASLGE